MVVIGGGALATALDVPQRPLQVEVFVVKTQGCHVVCLGKTAGLELAKVSGMQVDEYYGGAKSTRFMPALGRSLAQLSEHPDFAEKLWIPFLAGKFGASGGELLLRTVLGTGWPFSEEVYLGEMPNEAENPKSIRAAFLSLVSAYEKVGPGSVRRMIFTPMYAYLPYCTTNRCPQADFRVHLDMQMQMLATDPAFFGLWGAQPYRSNYVDEEILTCMAMLLRHYAIEGRTDRFITDPYELKHVANPDFAEVLPGGFSYPFRSCRGPKPFTRKEPFWMTYHWLRFRATGPTATLALSDWARPGEPGGPTGQQTMVNFVELQPVLEAAAQ